MGLKASIREAPPLLKDALGAAYGGAIKRATNSGSNGNESVNEA